MKTKISVVIPVYNAGNTIEKTLESIAVQSVSDFEVIMINDGATDCSVEICDKFVVKDNRFHLFSQENRGVSAARNNGISKASGDYLLFVDSDDTLPKKGIEILVDLQRKNEDFLVCGSHLMKKTRNRILEIQLNTGRACVNDKDAFSHYLKSIPTAPWGKLFMRKIIVDKDIWFPEEIPYGEDAIFLYNYLCHVNGIATTDKIVYEYYYLNPNSAGRRYYKDYYIYLRKQFDARTSLLNKLGITNENEEIVFFRRCLEHYIINEKNKVALSERIGDSIEFFPDAQKDKIYGHFIKLMDINGLIHCWKKKNFIFCQKEFLKRLF